MNSLNLLKVQGEISEIFIIYGSLKLYPGYVWSMWLMLSVFRIKIFLFFGKGGKSLQPLGEVKC